MIPVATCWLLLALPGYALLRRAWPRAFEGGVLSAIALSYLATFVLLTPFSVVGYLFRLPLVVLSTAAVALVVLAIGSLAFLPWPGVAPRRRFAAALHLLRWSGFSPIALVGSYLVGNNAIAGLATGAPLYGDARYHMARVRMIVDHGFNSWDPLVAGHRFENVYHTNLYHALMAAIAQLTSLPPATVWVYTLFWARLAAAASIYHLAWVLLGKRWLAWIAAAMFAVSASSNWMLAIPNNISVYALLTLGIACLVQLLVERELGPALALVAVCVVLPQFHALSFVFLAIAIGPALFVAFVHARLRRRPGSRELALGFVGIALGALWLVPQLPHRMQNAVDPQPPSVELAPEIQTRMQARKAHEEAYEGFLELPLSQLMFDPSPLRDPRNAGAQLLVALVVGLWTSRRRELRVFAGCSAALLSVLFVPPLCTLAFNTAGHGWIVKRIWGAFCALQPTIVPGAFLLLAAERLAPFALRLQGFARHAAQVLLPLTGLALALFVVHANDGDAALWPRTNRWRRSRFRAVAETLHVLADERAFLRKYVEPGALVVAPPVTSYDLMITCDCYALALPRGHDNYGIADMARRRAVVGILLGPEASLSQRVDLLQRYGAYHIYVPHYFSEESRALRQVYAPITVGAGKSNGVELLRVNPEAPLSRTPTPPPPATPPPAAVQLPVAPLPAARAGNRAG